LLLRLVLRQLLNKLACTQGTCKGAFLWEHLGST
jgi:hypothetical protein